MIKLIALAKRAAPRSIPILIQGESGTGKELFAKAIHKASPYDKSGEFVDVNCGAIPKDLFEAELFGVEKGAYSQSQWPHKRTNYDCVLLLQIFTGKKRLRPISNTTKT